MGDRGTDGDRLQQDRGTAIARKSRVPVPESVRVSRTPDLGLFRTLPKGVNP